MSTLLLERCVLFKNRPDITTTTPPGSNDKLTKNQMKNLESESEDQYGITKADRSPLISKTSHSHTSESLDTLIMKTTCLD